MRTKASQLGQKTATGAEGNAATGAEPRNSAIKEFSTGG